MEGVNLWPEPRKGARPLGRWMKLDRKKMEALRVYFSNINRQSSG